jgi:methyl-accepting chemotaxis protein
MVIGNALSAAVMLVILFIFRDVEVPTSRLMAPAGIFALVYAILASVVLCRNASCFNAEGLKGSGETYINALKNLGAVPIKTIGLSVLMQLLFLTAVFIRGVGLPAGRIPLFLTLFSVAVFASSFVYVVADGMVSSTLLSYNLTTYPRDLRENRQRLKILIIPMAVTIISILFSFSVPFLTLAQSGAILSAISGRVWVSILLPLFILFFAITALCAVLKRNLGVLYTSVIDQLESLSSAKKDLSKRISVCSVDELGTIAGMVNSFCDNMGGGIREIKKSQRELSASIVELEGDAAAMAASISQISGGVEQVHTKSQNQLASVSESSAAVQEIAKNIESLDGSISKQVFGVSQASSSVEEMVGNIKSIGGVVEKMLKQFKTVDVATAQVGTIQRESDGKVQEIVEESKVLQEANKIIASIAAQTNLLAMNAAIEAAHAGDTGKGFSVVADEIRKLAETSSGESQKISAKLKQIIQTINGIVKSSRASEQAFNHVSLVIGETEKLVFEVSNAMREQQAGADQALVSLKSMNDITAEVGTGSKEMNVGNVTMLREMSRLQSDSREISDSMDEMVKSVTLVKEGVEQVSVLAANALSAVSDVTVIVNSFEL